MVTLDISPTASWLGFSVFQLSCAVSANAWLFQQSHVAGSVSVTGPWLALTCRVAMGLKRRHSWSLLYVTGVFLESHTLQQIFP